MKYKLPLNGKWFEFDDDRLDKFREDGKDDVADELLRKIEEFDKNPISMFLPHGRKWRGKEMSINGRLRVPKSEYPKEWDNDGVAFLNDWTHGFVCMLAPNQVGKSKIATAKSCLYLIPNDPTWDIFQHTGVEPRKWEGPKILIAASYSWDNVKTLWERYKETLPRRELGCFSPNWGKYEGESGRQRDLSFGDGRPKDVTLACGSVIRFLCYTQQQIHWEGFSADALHADEQIPEEKFIGWSRGTTTRGDYTPCWMSFTGHVLDDRPDTGAGGWIKRKLYSGKDTKGRTIAWYGMDIESTPEAIISKVKREELWRQWADPDVARSEKDERAAIARYWGGWEEGSGLVLSEFDRRIHVIPPLFEDHNVPKNWTKWRAIDFGDSNISSCVWVAVSPSGIAVCYRVLYERGLSPHKLCKEIISRSHNERIVVGEDEDLDQGAVFTVYKEIQSHERFYATLLDSRSLKQSKGANTLEELFDRHGVNVVPACGKRNETQIPDLKEWLEIDMSKNHIITKELGAPRLYFFDGMCDDLLEEIEGLELDEKSDRLKFKKGCPDHAVDALKYWASDDPRYFGDDWGKEETGYDGNTPYTGA